MELTVGKTDEWGTPASIFEPLHKEFNFTVDVCATPGRQKLMRYFSPAQDGLKQDWFGERCWMNPPYGRAIVPWVKKAQDEARDPKTLVVAILPVRSDTAWWHDYVLPYAEVRFMRGRVKFVDAEGKTGDPAPFPTCIVVWK